jgi:hypothetical protein
MLRAEVCIMVDSMDARKAAFLKVYTGVEVLLLVLSICGGARPSCKLQHSALFGTFVVNVWAHCNPISIIDY